MEKRTVWPEHIRYVRGFNPIEMLDSYSLKEKNEAGEETEVTKRHLPLTVREDWFRLYFPDGVIIRTQKSQTDEGVICACELYRTYDEYSRENPRPVARETAAMAIAYVQADFPSYNYTQAVAVACNMAKSRAETAALKRLGFRLVEENEVDREEALEDQFRKEEEAAILNKDAKKAEKKASKKTAAKKGKDAPDESPAQTAEPAPEAPAEPPVAEPEVKTEANTQSKASSIAAQARKVEKAARKADVIEAAQALAQSAKDSVPEAPAPTEPPVTEPVTTSMTYEEALQVPCPVGGATVMADLLETRKFSALRWLLTHDLTKLKEAERPLWEKAVEATKVIVAMLRPNEPELDAIMKAVNM